MKKVGKVLSMAGIALCLGAMITGDILATKYYGMINDAINPPDYSSVKDEKVLAKGDAFVKEIMDEGIVMLKNDGHKAPFAYDESDPVKNRKVNIFGWSSTDAGFLISGYGSGVSRIPESKRVLFYDGFDKYNKTYSKKKIEYNPNLKSFYEKWCNNRAVSESLGGNDKLYTNYNPKVGVYTDEANKVNGKTLLQDAKDYSDNAIVVISRQSGEAQDCPQGYSYVVNEKGGSPTRVDRSYLSLTEEEIDLLNMVKENFSSVTVLLNCTNMVECGAFDDPKIQNVYYIGVTGQSGARAIPGILTGDVNPSGKITETLVTDHSENPSFYNFGRFTSPSTTYTEGIYVGYKFFETANEEGYWSDYSAKTAWKSNGKNGYEGIVEYPFGHGLSYSDFIWEVLDSGEEALSPARGSDIDLDSKIKINVKVTNVGTQKGKDVVELYYSAPYTKGGIEKSSINLLDFAKTKLLAPGESQVITFEEDPYYMASYDCYDKNNNGFKGYELEAGEYTLKLMKNAHESKLTDEGGFIKYNVQNAIKIEKDNVTKNEVKNHFTGDDATDKISIDGFDASKEDRKESSNMYLSRADFKGTFKSKTLSDYKKGGTATPLRTYETAPTFNADNGLYLYTDPNGNKITDPKVLQNPTADSVKVNFELLKELGSDYNAEKWDKLLDQLTYDDAAKLIAMGGYSTAEAMSVGKIWMRDNDGPMGLTRSNAELNTQTQWTWFPMSGLIGSSWNKDLAYDYGKTIANEAAATGVNGWYAPGCNIRRSPFGGRNNEYYSEDPILSGYIGASTVQGALKNRLACYVKHFALNECETNRGDIYTWCTEQTLRETYLKVFELVVKVGKTNGLMSAFNRVGGTPARQNSALLTQVLREEWGFRGAVVTDWMGGAFDAKEGITAGNDLRLNGAQNFSHNLGSRWYEDPTIANNVRNSCKNILYMVCNTQSQIETPANIVTVKRNEPLWPLAVVGINFFLADIAILLLYFAFFYKKS